MSSLRTGSAPASKSRWRRSIRSRNLSDVGPLVDIVAVEPVDGYRVRRTFADGVTGEVDFAARKWRGVFEPLADPEYFRRVKVDPELGIIAWPNRADMAPEPLYERCVAQSSVA